MEYKLKLLNYKNICKLYLERKKKLSERIEQRTCNFYWKEDAQHKWQDTMPNEARLLIRTFHSLTP